MKRPVLLAVYNLILFALSPLLLLAYCLRVLITGKEKNGFLQRLGLGLPQTNGCFWVHAVSVGESMAASALVRELSVLFPEETIVVSTITDAGNVTAKKMIPQAKHIFYLPLDFKPFVKKAMRRLKPKALIIVETELWPNFIREAKKTGSKVLLASGRISDRSLSKYQKAAFFFSAVLSYFDIICMQGPEEVQKMLSIGASPRNVLIGGNSKLDLIFEEPAEELKTALKESLHADGNAKLWIAGSTHPGEEKMILDVYKKLREQNAGMMLLLAPRHTQRCDEVEKLVKDAGFSCMRRTQLMQNVPLVLPSSGSVFLLDTMGELQTFYSIADVVFVGGSLVPVGGHNVLEPVSFGKSVFCGPYMQNFKGIMDILKPSGAVVQVADIRELEDKMLRVLKDEASLLTAGKKGKELIEKNRGASRFVAFLLKDLFTHAKETQPLDVRAL